MVSNQNVRPIRLEQMAISQFEFDRRPRRHLLEHIENYAEIDNIPALGRSFLRTLLAFTLSCPSIYVHYSAYVFFSYGTTGLLKS